MKKEKKRGLRLKLGLAGRILSIEVPGLGREEKAKTVEVVSDQTWSLVEALVAAFKGLPAVRCDADGSVELRYEVKLSWVVISVAPSGRVNVNTVAKWEPAWGTVSADQLAEDVVARERRLDKVDAERVGKGG